MGYSYGDGIEDQWGAGPEAGVKIFINETTFIRVLAQYVFPVAESFTSDGRFIYGLGLGVRFYQNISRIKSRNMGGVPYDRDPAF